MKGRTLHTTWTQKIAPTLTGYRCGVYKCKRDTTKMDGIVLSAVGLSQMLGYDMNLLELRVYTTIVSTNSVGTTLVRVI